MRHGLKKKDFVAAGCIFNSKPLFKDELKEIKSNVIYYLKNSLARAKNLAVLALGNVLGKANPDTEEGARENSTMGNTPSGLVPCSDISNEPRESCLDFFENERF